MQMMGWKRWAVGSVAALTVMGGGLITAHTVLAESPETMSAESTQAPPQRFGFGDSRMDRGFGQVSLSSEESQASLAEALGITVEELEAAQDTARINARDAALAEAVANGDITQEQADVMKELDGAWGDGGRGRGRVDDRITRGYGLDNYDKVLSEALGITLEELEAARDTALQNELVQAVEEGELTQEQVDEFETGQALRDYVDSAMEDAVAAALDKAVVDGVLTQEQADAYLDEWQSRGARGALGAFAGGLWDEMPGMGPGGMRDDMPGAFPSGQRGQRPGMRGAFGDSDDFPGGRGGMRGGFGNGLRDGTGQETPDTQSLEQGTPSAGITL
ncbi:MAG: hypothetical protein ACK2UO_12655 [Caldilineaceae bacterium]